MPVWWPLLLDTLPHPRLQSFLGCREPAFPHSAALPTLGLSQSAWLWPPHRAAPISPQPGVSPESLPLLPAGVPVESHLRVRSPALKGHTGFSEDAFSLSLSETDVAMPHFLTPHRGVVARKAAARALGKGPRCEPPQASRAGLTTVTRPEA